MLVDAKRQHVQRMFSEIAPRYDLLNHLLSFNVDRSWRRRALAALAWERAPGGTYVDLCAGTLDVSPWPCATQPRFSGHVLGADFAEPMLRAGSSKIAGQSVAPGCRRCTAVAAAARPERRRRDRGLWHQKRRGSRCRPRRDAFACSQTGRAVRGPRILDAPVARDPRRATTRTSTTCSRPSAAPSAATARPIAICRAPSRTSRVRDALAARMRDAGFANVTWAPLTFGVAALHVGQRS